MSTQGSVSESYLATMERLSWEQGEAVGRERGIAQERERVRKLIEQERAVSFPGGHWTWPFFDRLFAALDAESGGKEHNKRVAALRAAEQRVIETSRTLWGSMWAAKVQLPPECVLEWDQFSAANRALLALRQQREPADATGGTR